MRLKNLIHFLIVESTVSPPSKDVHSSLRPSAAPTQTQSSEGSRQYSNSAANSPSPNLSAESDWEDEKDAKWGVSGEVHEGSEFNPREKPPGTQGGEGEPSVSESDGGKAVIGLGINLNSSVENRPGYSSAGGEESKDDGGKSEGGDNDDRQSTSSNLQEK